MKLKENNKSSWSNASNVRKKDKYYSSMAKTIDKRVNANASNSRDMNNQFISIIKKLHSPSRSGKYHNHSHSEVYTQKVKKDKHHSKRISNKEEKISKVI